MNRSIFLALSFMALLGAHLNAAATENIKTLAASQFALTATSTVNTVWATAYQMTVALTNPTSSPTTSWTATFTMPQGYTLSSYVSSGKFAVSGQNVTVTNLSGAGVIQPHGSTSFQMIIDMPQSKPTVINNLQATANGSPTPPPNVPVAPVLNAITSISSSSYTVSWNSVTNATSYTLQQDITSGFSNPTIAAQGNVLSHTFTNVPNGTYFYRVLATDASGNSPYSNTQSITVSQTPPPNVPVAPALNAIIPISSSSYTVSWNSVTNATTYTLQQDITSGFSNPTVAAQGNVLSHTFTNVPNGTYFYRVLATDASGNSPYSNTQSITLTQTPPPPMAGIEHSAWYIDWTSWFTGPPFVIPTGVNLLNVFVGELTTDANANPTLGGFGNMTLPQLSAFTAYCAAQVPPIAVKVSIGGGGGSYDNCWDILTAANVPAFAQGMAAFCHAHGLVGVDFDYEEFASAAQEALVGTLIKEFKAIDPTFQTSLCTNAGFGPNYPWQQAVENILNAATIAPGNCAVDRLYVMSYYDPIQSEENWVLGWANWVIQNYGFTPARVSVGIDDFDAHAYDPVEFAAWAASMGFSTAHWAFDPARPQ